MSPEDIDNRFDYHAPTKQRAARHQLVRDTCATLAEELNELLPEGREKALAMTKVEEAMFWANAAVARQEGKAA
ncbi:Acb2/Tad1 domain-containing protein [Micromonospora sp. NBC_01813]|uniref:Acb2/Tad1 domain-containing protein n=1 Tax=Micromonospora sp. NBC_01813 TaxID=2975988 RepID=UPI002DD85937|nr:hypothetical protein [Micromonospora sp. NBC_01813]WSA11567.1 hypothetical protein OG958_12730 [Micromonospora sp. NBC_01813]